MGWVSCVFLMWSIDGTWDCWKKSMCLWWKKISKGCFKKTANQKRGILPSPFNQKKKTRGPQSTSKTYVCYILASHLLHIFLFILGVWSKISPKKIGVSKKNAFFFRGFLSLKGRFRRSTTPHGVETTANLWSWLAIQVMLEASC